MEEESKTIAHQIGGVPLESSLQSDKKEKPASLKQPLRAASSLNTLADLQLGSEKTELMKNSVFYNLLQLKNRRESSATLISRFCEVYDPVKKSFVFNKNVSFSFCAEEVAEVLGIKNTGNSLEYTDAKRFPEYVYLLKEKLDPDGSKQIKTKSIKIFLEGMTIDDEESRSIFKQLLSYYLIERFLLCCPDPKKTRVSSWGMVEDMNAFEEVNWAKTIYDNICESFRKLKAVMHKQQQHYFLGCAPVFEAIVFKRIKPLEPKANPGKHFLPIGSYQPKRDWKPLKFIEASEITPCSYCGDVAESSLVSAFVDICIDDADSQPSLPVNDDAQPVNDDAQPMNDDAQPPSPPPLRRSLRRRKGVDRLSPI